MNPPGPFPAALLVIVVASLASMGVWVLLGAKRDADTDAKSGQFFGGLGNLVQHWFIWAISPLTALSLRLGLTPDFYNFAGLAFGLLAGVLIALGRLELGGWAIALSGVCDILDGRIARTTGVASAYGEFVDATFDRFVEVFAFLGFAFFLGGVGPILATAALAGSLLVSYTRARGEALGVDCTGGLMQRTERLVLTCLACLLDPAVTARLGWPLGALVTGMLGVIAVATLVTVIHRTVWISRRLATLDSSPHHPAFRGPV